MKQDSVLKNGFTTSFLDTSINKSIKLYEKVSFYSFLITVVFPLPMLFVLVLFDVHRNMNDIVLTFLLGLATFIFIYWLIIREIYNWYINKKFNQAVHRELSSNEKLKTFYDSLYTVDYPNEIDTYLHVEELPKYLLVFHKEKKKDTK